MLSKKLFILLFILLISASAYAGVIFNADGESSDGKMLKYIGEKQTDNPLTLEKNKFISVSQKLSLGYTWDKHWFWFKIENRTSKKIIRLISFDDGFMTDNINFFQVENGHIVKIARDGGYMPTDRKIVSSSGAVAKIELKPHTSTDVFVSVVTHTPFIVSIRLLSMKDFVKGNILHNLFIMAVCASLLSIAFYNLFLFFSLRMPEYIYYVFYVFSAVVFFLAESGFMNEFMGVTGDNRIWMFLSVYSMGFFFVLFTQTVLESKKYLPKLNTWLNILAAFNIIGVVIALFFGMKQTLFLQTPFAQIFALSLFTVSVTAVYKKISASWYYMLANGIGIIGIFVSSLFFLGEVQYTFYTRYAYFLSLVCETILLSLLLSYRINSLRQQKMAAQEDLIQMQKKNNQMLEKAVEARTKELDVKNRELERLSTTDELTGLLNRRFISTTFEKKINTENRKGKFLAFLMLDLDFFKHYNDTYGHIAGDKILKTVSGIMKETFKRESDYLFRIGGEEFVVLYYVETFSEAKDFAENLRLSIMNEKIPHETGGQEKVVTASLGLCVAKVGRFGFDEYYRIADEQLYLAKESGRNTVCSADYTVSDY